MPLADKKLPGPREHVRDPHELCLRGRHSRESQLLGRHMHEPSSEADDPASVAALVVMHRKAGIPVGVDSHLALGTELHLQIGSGVTVHPGQRL
jgi:hypothetical protein